MYKSKLNHHRVNVERMAYTVKRTEDVVERTEDVELN